MASLKDHIEPRAASTLLRAHFPAHQGRLHGPTGLKPAELARDVPYVRRSAITRSEQAVAQAVGARASFFLNHGASQGLLTACLLLARLTRRVAVAADVHIAVARGMVLADLLPTIVPSAAATPTTDEILAFLADEPPPALIVTSPSYRGECLDIDRIAGRCAAAGVLLVVDEVHGSRFRWTPGTPATALDASCALVLHSPHKYLGSLVQGAVLHVPHDSPVTDREVMTALELLDTTSRSNLIQASIEAAVLLWAQDDDFRRHRIEVLAALRAVDRMLEEGSDGVLGAADDNRDPWKLVLHSDRLTGYQLARRLLDRGIDHEYANIDEVLLVFSPAHAVEEIDGMRRTLAALRADLAPMPRLTTPPPLPMTPRRFGCSPREAHRAPGDEIRPVERALGAICRAAVCIETPDVDGSTSGQMPSPEATPRMPPGAPVLWPGERITPWHVAALGPGHRVDILGRG